MSHPIIYLVLPPVAQVGEVFENRLPLKAAQSLRVGASCSGTGQLLGASRCAISSLRFDLKRAQKQVECFCSLRQRNRALSGESGVELSVWSALFLPPCLPPSPPPPPSGLQEAWPVVRPCDATSSVCEGRVFAVRRGGRQQRCLASVTA